MSVAISAALQQPTEAVVAAAKYLTEGTSAAFERDRERRLQAMWRVGREVIASLKLLADITYAMETNATQDPGAQAADDASLREMLEIVRDGAAILSGEGLRRFERELEAVSPDLVGQYRRLLPIALERTRGLQALLSFLLGEHADVDERLVTRWAERFQALSPEWRAHLDELAEENPAPPGASPPPST